jgi:hypothetical protein
MARQQMMSSPTVCRISMALAQAAEKLPDTFLPVFGKPVTEGPAFAPVPIHRPTLQQVGGLRVQDDAVTVDVPLPKGVCGTHDMGFIPVSWQRYITHRVIPGIIHDFLSKAHGGSKPFPPGIPRV